MYETLIQEYPGQLGKGQAVDDIVDWVEDLPPIPEMITRALRLAEDITTSPKEIAEVIMLDPALASPILRSANSAALGHQREVTTLALAILVVGMGRLKAMLLASALRRWNGKIGAIERLVWEKSLGGAAAARVLCEELNKPYQDELYLTGLLHNLGQIVLLSHKEIGPKYRAVLNRIGKNKEDYVTAEHEVIGFSHPLVGALVAWKWGFPIATCRAILHYPDPLDKISGTDDEKLALLKLATLLGLFLGFGRPEGHPGATQKELDTLAVLVGFKSDTLQTDLRSAMRKIELRYASEISAFT